MKMPERWEKLRTYDKEIHRPVKLADLWEALDLLEEMANALAKINRLRDILCAEPEDEEAFEAVSLSLQKFLEWK